MSDVQPRTLDEWYFAVNKVYLDRNFYRDPTSLFAHLVEVVGGLSLLASGKTKAGVVPEAYVPKALAWWLALCGKLRIRSVEDMVWSKFPGVCPYCRRRPHHQDECAKAKRQSKAPDWEELASIAKERREQRPATLGGWLTMFGDIYPAQSTEQYDTVFARFAEELGELAEATRLFAVAPGYFFSEASDLFAWLMHLQLLVYMKSDVYGSDREIKLTSAMFSEYPGKCSDCGNPVCTCPPVLLRTCGRIAHDMPILTTEHGAHGLFEFEEAMEAFRLGSRVVRVGNETIDVSGEDLADLRRLVKDLQRTFHDVKGQVDAHTVTLIHTLNGVEDLVQADRITQEALNELIEAIQRVPSDQKTVALGILASVASAPVAKALLALLG